MKLSDLRKTIGVTFTGPDGQTASINVRAADAEFILRGDVEIAKIRADLGLGPDAELPLGANIKAGIMARLGTIVTGWSDNWETDAGEPIPARRPDGTLNEEGGYQILLIAEVLNAINAEVDRQRKALTDAKEAAAKNLHGPLEVN